MESILAVIALVSIVLFLFSFFDSLDFLSIFLNLLVPEYTKKKIRWVLGAIALVSTIVFVLYSIRTQ